MKYVLIIAAVFAVYCFVDYTGNQNDTPDDEKSPTLEKWKRDKAEAEIGAVLVEVNRRMQHAMLYGNRQAIMMYQPMAQRLADIQREMFQQALNGSYDPRMYREEIREMRKFLQQTQ